MEKMKFLNDEELEKVSGGGEGTIPSEGIHGEVYDEVLDGYYYTKNITLPSCSEVVWTWYDVWGNFKNSLEMFNIDSKSGEWYSAIKQEVYNISKEEIKTQYPYRLNVRP